MAGKLEGLEGERASKGDFMNHLGNLYPEVRFFLGPISKSNILFTTESSGSHCMFASCRLGSRHIWR